MMIRLLPALLLASIPAFPGGVHSEVVKPNHVAVEWISEVKAIQPGTPFWVALRLAHDPHWHTYWKNPGDSGLATKVALKEWQHVGHGSGVNLRQMGSNKKTRAYLPLPRTDAPTCPDSPPEPGHQRSWDDS